jgi:hypothetical protein
MLLNFDAWFILLDSLHNASTLELLQLSETACKIFVNLFIADRRRYTQVLPLFFPHLQPQSV